MNTAIHWHHTYRHHAISDILKEKMSIDVLKLKKLKKGSTWDKTLEISHYDNEHSNSLLLRIS